MSLSSGLDRAKRRQLLAEARRHWENATLLTIYP